MSLSRNTTRSLKERYEDFRKIGEGAYGVVYRARDSDTNRLVAVKKMGSQDSQEDGEDGVSAATLREMSILKELKHPNIVSLLETYYERKTTYLVFEFIDFDLKKYLDLSKRSEQPFRINGLKIMFHLLNATEYLHSRGIIHRDIKPQNILVDKNKSVKLADFGLSRFYLPSVTMTHEVVTLWYRAPEVLLGIKRYTAAVDVWSLGCIFAELSNCKPLFSGDSEVDQLFRIFQVQGTPSSENSPSLCELKQYNAKMPKWKKVNLSQKCPKMNHLEIDLLEKMLELDPLKRISVRKALQHPVFAQIQP